MSNDELMVEIFERLPPKSIIRFRSLSKYWHPRLLSPDFLHRHRLRSSKNPPKVMLRHVIGRECHRHKEIYALRECHKHREIYTLHSRDQLPLDPDDSNFVRIPGVEFSYYLDPLVGSVIGSCNGILCVQYTNIRISLWNFSIRRKLIVPCHPPMIPSTYNTGLALGFGFDPIADDYNIVALSYNSASFIYSLKTDSWSATPSPPDQLSSPFVMPKACFFNGILHWVVQGYSESWNNFILTFNLSSRVYGCILLPDRYWTVEQLTAINGCLAVVRSHNNGPLEDRYMWIWVMKEYGDTESWYALLKLKTKGPYWITVFQPVVNGDILAYCPEDSKVYNTRTSLTKCLEFGRDCIKVEMDPYVESLELLDKERATTCTKTGKLYSLGPKKNKFIANLFCFWN